MPDREKVIEELETKKWETVLSRAPFEVPWDLIDDTLTLLKEQEVVRCKDCKHGYPCKNAAGEDSVECLNHYVSLDSICRKPDWFCADGVRESD